MLSVLHGTEMAFQARWCSEAQARCALRLDCYPVPPWCRGVRVKNSVGTRLGRLSPTT